MAAFRPSGRRRARQSDTGQVLVIFAVSITVLFAAAGLAFDIGRFYSERRFLQNAADAAALAAASALIRGETVAQADAEARDILTRNFMSSPSGVTPSLPPPTGSEVYASGHSGEPAYLLNGILINGNDIRVAVQNTLGYTFGRVVGLDQNTIGGQARVKTNGYGLPIAVRHYINAPGPTTGALQPCDGDVHNFQDLLSTADTSCLGSVSSTSLRNPAAVGSDFNPLNPNDDTSRHGPIIQLVGQGAQSSNSSSFRGFVALDIRDFSAGTSGNATSNVYYNGVTTGMGANTLADLEAGWVANGYPGPAFPPATTNPVNFNDQVGILDGTKSGIIMTAIANRFRPGDEILASVYSGTVMTIPDFALAVGSTQTIGTTENRNGAVTMSATKNASFAGTVTAVAFADYGDPTSPYGTTLSPITLTPTPATPPTTITWATFNTVGATPSIHTIWIQGHSPSPYLTDHFYPVAINIGGVLRDFAPTGAGMMVSIPTTGATGTGSFSIGTSGNGSQAFAPTGSPSTIFLSLEGPPNADPALSGALPIGLGAWSLCPAPQLPPCASPSSFPLSKGLTQTINVSINGGSLVPGEYPLTIRATGTNSDGQTVTRLIPIVLDVATGSSGTQYVDITGFALFRITNIDTSNSIDGYAISGMYTNPNDPALRRGQVARLVPWN
jgi:Flp pilus assembly protein TadG